MLRRLRDDEGAVSILTALLVLALLASLAVAVDVGRVAATSRDQQGVTDRAALDALLTLDRLGPTADVVGAVEASLARNAGGLSSGRQLIDVNPWDCANGVALVDANGNKNWGNATGVEVSTATVVSSLFLPASDPTDVGRTAVACSRPVAAVSAASTLGTLDDGLVNSLLSALLGGAEVSLVGWQGIAGATVTLADLAVELGVGSLEQLLAAEVTASQLAAIIVDALAANGNDVGIDVGLLNGLLALPVDLDLPPIALGDVLDVTTGAESALHAGVDAFGLLLAGLQVANHQHAATLDLVAAGLPVRLRIIEPPTIAIGPAGTNPDGSYRTVARTAQLGLDVQLPLGTVQQQAGSGAGTVISDEIAALVQPLRDEIDGISTCVGAVAEAATSPSSTLRRRIQKAIDDLNAAATAEGLGFVVQGLVGLVGGILSSLGSILSGVGCVAAGLVGQAGAMRDSIKSDLHELLDVYQGMLVALAQHGTVAPAAPSLPALSVRAASGTVALTGASCAGDGQVATRVEGSAAQVMLSSWGSELVAAPSPSTVRLLDLDLGLVRATVPVNLNVTLGGGPGNVHDPVSFTGPFPAAPWTGGGTSTLGLGDVLGGVSITPQITVLGALPLGGLLTVVTDLVWNALDPVLATLDDVVTPLVETLGLRVGVVEAQALSVDCSGRRLVR